MMESYKKSPKPCATMNMVVIPNMETDNKIKNTTIIYVNLPVEYTEIKQERVRGKKKFNKCDHFLFFRNFLGKACGEMLVDISVSSLEYQ